MAVAAQAVAQVGEDGGGGRLAGASREGGGDEFLRLGNAREQFAVEMRQHVVGRRARDELLPKYLRRAAEAGFDTELQSAYPGLVMDEESPAVRLVRELTGANRIEAVAYGTEAGQFQRYGIPAVICGPGSIDQAHKPDEFCELSEFTACEAFLRKVIARASI